MVRERITNRIFNDTFLIPPDQDTLPPMHSFFACAQPLEVDIGCGRGRFLLAHAKNFPHLNFLGIDLSLLRLRKIDRKALAGNFHNIRLMNGEALRVLAALPARSVSTFYLYFPDPWPKRRHHVRRIVSPSFVDLISRALAPRGIIHLCTDHHEYFAVMQSVWRRDLRYAEIPPYLPTEDEESDFCLIFKSQGLTPNRCSFQKQTQPENIHE